MAGPLEYEKTSDLEDGRVKQSRFVGKSIDFIDKISQEALQSPAMSHPNSRLVIMNCAGGGPQNRGKVWGASRDHSIFGKTVILTVSAHKNQISHNNDFGIPPLPIKPVHLAKSELDDIQTNLLFLLQK